MQGPYPDWECITAGPNHAVMDDCGSAHAPSWIGMQGLRSEVLLDLQGRCMLTVLF